MSAFFVSLKASSNRCIVTPERGVFSRVTVAVCVDDCRKGKHRLMVLTVPLQIAAGLISEVESCTQSLSNAVLFSRPYRKSYANHFCYYK